MKKFLLSLFSLCSLCALFAEELVMTIVTDNGHSAPVSNVSFLLAADNDEEFGVILKEGDPIYNVKTATFEMKSAGVDDVLADGDVLRILSVSTELSLAGVQEGSDILIFNEAGALVKSVRAEASAITINISDLAAGCYILNASGSSVKFIKK